MPSSRAGVRLLPNAVTVLALCSGLSAVNFALAGRYDLCVAAIAAAGDSAGRGREVAAALGALADAGLAPFAAGLSTLMDAAPLPGQVAQTAAGVAPRFRAAAVRQALTLMSTWGVSQIPVLENGQSVGGLIEGTLMTRALAQPALLDRPVSEVMDPPFPEVDAGTATDRVGSMLTRENPAALVRKDGELIGIVSRYDVLQQLIGTR